MGKESYLDGKKMWSAFIDKIDAGRLGNNTGLPMGFNRLSEHISNIQPGRYDLIGGATGTGKTALVDDAYVFNPISYLEAHPKSRYSFEVVYYSMEISPERKLAKLICRRIWEEHKILVTPKELYSQGFKYKVSDKVYNLLHNYQAYYEMIINKYILFRTTASPDYVYKDLMEYVESRGTIIREEGTRIIKEYIPHNPNLITLVVFDHISLLNKGREDSNKKEAIDRLSKYLVFFRNEFKLSPVVVSQFNRSIEGMDRRREGVYDPQLSDFKDTGSTQEDADTVLSLYNPLRYGITEHNDYDISQLGRNYRGLEILKNRDGDDNLTIGMYFLGEVGLFKELPAASKLALDPKLFAKILNYRINGD
jgi:replicative DNA helicase